MIEIMDADRVRELLSYDRESGTFHWRISPRNGIGVGAVAGCANRRNYWQIRLDGRPYLAHRLAFLHVLGRLPNKVVDHIDGDTLNNRWINLREASHSQNGGNTRLSRRNTSGFKGVSYHAGAGKWRATLGQGGRAIYLGLFDTPEAAHHAYIDAARDHFGEFLNNGEGNH